MSSFNDYKKNYDQSRDGLIKVDLLKIEECGGNIKKLLGQWEKRKCDLSKQFGNVISQGFTADEMFGEESNSKGMSGKGMLDVLDEISDATTELLKNSIAFFENLKVSFEDVDSKVAKSLKN